jgi:hypothetical protein
MDNFEVTTIEQVGEKAVERARKTFSKQPRFRDNGTDGVDMYRQIYGWIKLAVDEIDEEQYQVDSRRRDGWLNEFWRLEPHWSGIVKQVVLVDSARPWTLTGGRNQVRRYANVLHFANNGKGWRHYFRQESLAYRVTDLGPITEIGRWGRNGPMTAIYHTDPTRCRWSSKNNAPLWYYPPRGRRQAWRDRDFFNITSLPNIDEKMLGLGWCSTSGAFQLVKILYGVLMHDQEMIGARMPRGILFLNGIEEDQWDTALEARDAESTQQERQYYGGVMILAGLGAQDASGTMMALSQLPANFDRGLFLDQVIFGYSLLVGYDPREFWPVSSGSLGTARETETQHRKSATKGTLEFPHAWQEQFQKELPETLHFEFEERDTDAQMMLAELALVWTEVLSALTKGDQVTQESILDAEQAMTILVNKGIVPAEWTATEEETVVSDMASKERRQERWRSQVLEYPEIRRMIEEMPDEPIIIQRWSPTRTTEHTLFASGHEALKKRVF